MLQPLPNGDLVDLSCVVSDVIHLLKPLLIIPGEFDIRISVHHKYNSKLLPTRYVS